MFDSVPLFPIPRRHPDGVPLAGAPLDAYASFERERDALVARWRRLCDEMEAIDRRLDELELLIGGW